MSLLKLEDLYQAQEKRTKSNRKVFEEILKRCHRRILEVNRKVQITQCYFQIPSYIFGYPAYNLEEANEYLCHKLNKNGLLVYPINNHTIYICWDPEVIDYEKYLKSRQKETFLMPSPEETDAVSTTIKKPGIRNSRAPKNKVGSQARASKVKINQGQPTAMIQFDSDFEDMIPVNMKKVNARQPKTTANFPWLNN